MTEHLVSEAPRPQTFPSAISPEKGGRSQEPSAGTTSWWLMSTRGFSLLFPFQKNSRFPSISVFSSCACTRGKRLSSSRWKARNFSRRSSPGTETVSHRTIRDSFPAYNSARPGSGAGTYVDFREGISSVRTSETRIRKNSRPKSAASIQTTIMDQAASFRSFRQRIQLSAMAMAPLGMIMKLVEEVREGTRMNRRIMAHRGTSASRGSFR